MAETEIDVVTGNGLRKCLIIFICKYLTNCSLKKYKNIHSGLVLYAVKLKRVTHYLIQQYLKLWNVINLEHMFNETNRCSVVEMFACLGKHI